MKIKFLFVVFLISIQSLFAQQITGSWKGEVNYEGTKIPVIFNIEKVKDFYKSTTDSPLQQVEGIPADKTTFENNELTIEIKSIDAIYKGKLEGQKINGTLTQAGVSLPLILLPYKKPVKATSAEVITLPENLDKSLKNIDDFLSYLEKNKAEAGEISIFRNGKEIYKRNFGQQNLPNLPNTDKIFQIGSITKTMTAVMLFKLIEKKKLNLEDKLSKYFPEISNAEKITINQMLNHSAGLGDYVQGKEEVKWLVNQATDQQIINHIKEQGSVFEPGSNSRYSNSGYYLLTKILEKITKKTYAENLRKNFVKPLNLQDFYTASQDPKNVFKPYQYEGSWKPVKDFDFNNVVGVGDIATTPSNLNVIINAFFAGKLVSENSLSKMLPKEDDVYGKGIIKVPFFSKIFYGHSGGTYGTNSLMIFNPEDQISFSYSINADKIGANNFAIGILSLLYDQSYTYPTLNNEKVAVSKLEKYVGVYSTKDIPFDIKIFIRDEVLFGQGTNQQEFPLDFEENDQFKYEKAGVKINFIPEKKQLQLMQGGGTILFDKK